MKVLLRAERDSFNSYPDSEVEFDIQRDIVEITLSSRTSEERVIDINKKDFVKLLKLAEA